MRGRRRPRRLQRPQRATQEALWRDAGITRTRAGLERLLANPHPLARLIAACALHREESRGAHQRADFPSPIRRSTTATRSSDPTAARA